MKTVIPTFANIPRTSNTQRTSKKKLMGFTSSKRRRNKMIQFIAGAIFGGAVGFMILAIVTAGRDEK